MLTAHPFYQPLGRHRKPGCQPSNPQNLEGVRVMTVSVLPFQLAFPGLMCSKLKETTQKCNAFTKNFMSCKLALLA